MLFSSPIFIFLFLPVVLAIHLILGRALRNYFLLLVSLFFYAWGETVYVLVMLASIVINYILAEEIERRGRSGTGRYRSRKTLLIAAVIFNLGMLAYFKYANFAADSVNALLQFLGISLPVLAPIHLPIGISFFTFQALSYVIDVYRKEVPSQKQFANSALYISFFPQLIAGPIVRYHHIAGQLTERITDLSAYAAGIRRFIFGLAKKVLIADTMGAAADAIFGIPRFQLTTDLAWLGIACYTLQIYFDFSGYSDMAIGLGRMFGFKFRENFNYPYISQSITEFWRRWHISLSTWFRDYLYIPLGGNRKSKARTYMNLLVVFLLCGLWHGASWTFIIWGLYHGLFLILERLSPFQKVHPLLRPMRHVYTLLVVMIGWVFFRAETLQGAGAYLEVLFGRGHVDGALENIKGHLNPDLMIALTAGIIISTPVLPWLTDKFRKVQILAQGGGPGWTAALKWSFCFSEVMFFISIALLSVSVLSIETFNPFIYFRF